MLAVTGAALAAAPAPKLELRHQDALTDGYRLKTVTWWVDGATLATWNGVGEEPTPEIQLHPVELAPGMHSLAVTAVYEGHSSLFPYVNGYRFRMRARMVIDARPGYVIQLKSRAFEADGFTLDWRDRPRFEVDSAPTRAILEEELLPVEGLPKGTEEPPEIAVVPAAGSGSDPVEVVSECGDLPPIHFSFSGFRLNARARKALDALSACMVKHRDYTVVLEGHCDSRGTEGFNLTLADWRIDSARRYLVSRGVHPERIERRAFGEARLVCGEDTDACHARNRRVEFEVQRSSRTTAQLR